jgi:hypothetical protein
MRTLDGRTATVFPSTSPAADAASKRKASIDNKIFGIGVGERFPTLPECKRVTDANQPHCLGDEPKPPNYFVLVNGSVFDTCTRNWSAGLLTSVNPGTKKVETVTFNCSDPKTFAKVLQQKYGVAHEVGRYPIANGDHFHYVAVQPVEVRRSFRALHHGEPDPGHGRGVHRDREYGTRRRQFPGRQ